ncbi:MAG: 50S ribosomal protein L25 [Candidatus Coatesbacteria bacterium]|nr:50S ribosomal protein L25 [Candidatus Coatesbacteria bacterium]
MAENLRLNASLREGRGKSCVRKMRQNGLIPGVVYGRRMDPIPVSIVASELAPILRLSDYETELIDLNVDNNEPMDVLVKEAQFDHVGTELLHIDFFRIIRGTKLTLDVPVVVHGTAPGVKAGGMLQHNMRIAKIKCLPRNLIHEIAVDISVLEIGDSIHVRDLAVPETIEILEEPQRTVVTVLARKGEEAAVIEGEAGETEAEEENE